VTVSGKNWPPGHSIAIAFPDRGFWGPGSATVAPDGSFTYTFAWPSPAAPGEHQVATIDNTGPVNAPGYPVFTVTSPGGADPQSGNSAAAVTFSRTYVADANWAEATQFAPGDLVRYQVVISAGGEAIVNARVRAVGPDGDTIIDTGGDVRVTPSAGSVFFQATIPASAPAGLYTVDATVISNGAPTRRTSTFTVSGGGGQPGGQPSGSQQNGGQTSPPAAHPSTGTTPSTPAPVGTPPATGPAPIAVPHAIQIYLARYGTCLGAKYSLILLGLPPEGALLIDAVTKLADGSYEASGVDSTGHRITFLVGEAVAIGLLTAVDELAPYGTGPLLTCLVDGQSRSHKKHDGLLSGAIRGTLHL
jgi:hypothetical protein